MKAIKSTTKQIPASAIVPAKSTYSMKGNVTLTGDGVKTLLQLVQDEIGTITDLDEVLAAGKTVQLVERLNIEGETADLT